LGHHVGSDDESVNNIKKIIKHTRHVTNTSVTGIKFTAAFVYGFSKTIKTVVLKCLSYWTNNYKITTGEEQFVFDL
jgi:hypothetical protein